MSEAANADWLWLSHQLRKALSDLYDPASLRQSPLIDVFELRERRDPAGALRQLLLESIEALKPVSVTPQQSKMWRTYHILHNRYVEQMSQRVVASDLGLSTRQLQREESDARDALVYHLLNTRNLEPLLKTFRSMEHDALGKAGELAQELEWLRETIQPQITDVDALLRQALMMLKPVLDVSETRVITDFSSSLPRLNLQAPLLLQALLNLLGIVRSAPQSHVHLSSRSLLSHVEIRMQARMTGEMAGDFDLSLTQHLIELCGGTLTVPDAPDPFTQFEAVIRLAVDQTFTVLVIDDNADTQQLYQRYLKGSCYRYLAAATFEEGLALANSSAPDVVVLDVMMPQSDGWTVLGQLRYQPATSHIPIIVCTILAQEELAFALGAADFIRKPVSRPAFLSALNRQVGLLEIDGG